MTRIFALFFFGLILASACSAPVDDGGELSSERFSFDPIFKGKTAPEENGGVPFPPENLASMDLGSRVRLSWQTRKGYTASSSKAGFLIYQKTLISPLELKNWDFQKARSEGETTEIGKLLASQCAPSGECVYEYDVVGPKELFLSVITTDNAASFSARESVAVSVEQTVSLKLVDLNFSVGFFEKEPSFSIGRIVGDGDREPPSYDIYDLRAREIPWFLLPLSSEVEVENLRLLKRSPLVPALSGNSLQMIIPESSRYRAALASRGDERSCEGSVGKWAQLCEASVLARPLLTLHSFGQTNFQFKHEPFVNPLASSRVFDSRSAAILKSDTGQEYVFVADEQRILVRRKSVDPCSIDPGEAGNTFYGVEGSCGFEWSIGTFSPRQRCARDLGGVPVVGLSECDQMMMNFGLRDDTPPTDYTLRRPGTPAIVGKHLYIPDSGNARVLRLSNFEEAFKSCGKLRAATDATTNDFCKFDMVLGQRGVSDGDPARFSLRSCVRGGEIGGYDGNGALPDSASFVDPLGQGGSGGTGCRLDTVTRTTPSGDLVRRARLPGAFSDIVRSMISPETGLMDEISRRSFRAPVQIGRDSRGRIYILDYGYTRVESKVGDFAATLAPRIMVWTRDPFSYRTCPGVVGFGANADGSCEIMTSGECVGDACEERECVAEECNATYIIGQRAELFAHTHLKSQYLGEDFSPDNYYPLTAFALGTNAGITGVWAVTGKDARVFHWRGLGQSERPAIHNALSPSAKYLDWKYGVFAGIAVDSNVGDVIVFDTNFHVGVAWSGDSKKP